MEIFERQVWGLTTEIKEGLQTKTLQFCPEKSFVIDIVPVDYSDFYFSDIFYTSYMEIFERQVWGLTTEIKEGLETKTLQFCPEKSFVIDIVPVDYSDFYFSDIFYTSYMEIFERQVWGLTTEIKEGLQTKPLRFLP